jgi:cell wall-associated NlpC family hydrolase
MNTDKIIAKAREYKGVRFQHFGRSKSGIDCTNLLHISLVAGSANPKTVPDLPVYTKRPRPLQLLKGMQEFMDPIEKEEAKPGDIVLMKYKGHALHLALYTGETIIHAAIINRKVIEHPIDETVKPNICRFFRFKEI